MDTPIKEQWESYEREVVPANASAEQRLETRRAFYAGAQAMLTTSLGRNASTPELLAFAQDVEEGRA